MDLDLDPHSWYRTDTRARESPAHDPNQPAELSLGSMDSLCSIASPGLRPASQPTQSAQTALAASPQPPSPSSAAAGPPTSSSASSATSSYHYLQHPSTTPPPSVTPSITPSSKSPISELQELSQRGRLQAEPDYSDDPGPVEGDPFACTCTVQLADCLPGATLDTPIQCTATGRSKKEAKTAAARAVLDAVFGSVGSTAGSSGSAGSSVAASRAVLDVVRPPQTTQAADSSRPILPAAGGFLTVGSPASASSANDEVNRLGRSTSRAEGSTGASCGTMLQRIPVPLSTTPKPPVASADLPLELLLCPLQSSAMGAPPVATGVLPPPSSLTTTVTATMSAAATAHRQQPPLQPLQQGLLKACARSTGSSGSAVAGSVPAPSAACMPQPPNPFESGQLSGLGVPDLPLVPGVPDLPLDPGPPPMPPPNMPYLPPLCRVTDPCSFPCWPSSSYSPRS